MFSGRASWDEIARVVEALDIPVIGNGDVQTAEDVAKIKAHTGCAGVMALFRLLSSFSFLPPFALISEMVVSADVLIWLTWGTWAGVSLSWAVIFWVSASACCWGVGGVAGS